MRKLLVTGVAMLLAVAGCGGSDDDASNDSDDSATPTQPPTTDDAGSSDDAGDAPTPTQAPTTEAPADDGDSGGDAEGSGPSTATLTINGETYNVSTEGAVVAQCQTDMFGVFTVNLPMADGGDGGIMIVALLEGTDPTVVDQLNAVRVSIGDDDWLADEGSDIFDMSDQLEPGMSQVDSVEVDGSTVRGSGTFLRDLSVFTGEPETATGTFEATCGEERIS